MLVLLIKFLLKLKNPTKIGERRKIKLYNNFLSCFKINYKMMFEYLKTLHRVISFKFYYKYFSLHRVSLILKKVLSKLNFKKPLVLFLTYIIT